METKIKILLFSSDCLLASQGKEEECLSTLWRQMLCLLNIAGRKASTILIQCNSKLFHFVKNLVIAVKTQIKNTSERKDSRVSVQRHSKSNLFFFFFFLFLPFLAKNILAVTEELGVIRGR